MIEEMVGRPVDVTALVATSLFFLTVMMVVASVAFVAIVRAWRSGGGGHTKAESANEARSMQELERGFRKMEQRLESLETLILDRASEHNIHEERF